MGREKPVQWSQREVPIHMKILTSLNHWLFLVYPHYQVVKPAHASHDVLAPLCDNAQEHRGVGLHPTTSPQPQSFERRAFPKAFLRDTL